MTEEYTGPFWDDYSPLTFRKEGSTLIVDGWPEYVLFSERFLAMADPQRVSISISIYADNGDATYVLEYYDDDCYIGKRQPGEAN